MSVLLRSSVPKALGRTLETGAVDLFKMINILRENPKKRVTEGGQLLPDLEGADPANVTTFIGEAWFSARKGVNENGLVQDPAWPFSGVGKRQAL